MNSKNKTINVTGEKGSSADQILNNEHATLISTIIHDINNPMTWISSNLGYIKMCLNKLEANNPDQEMIKKKINDALDDTLVGCEKIKEITTNLRSFIPIENVQNPKQKKDA